MKTKKKKWLARTSAKKKERGSKDRRWKAWVVVAGIRCFNILSAIICLVLRVLSLEFDHVQWCCFGSTAEHGHKPPGGSQWLAITGSKEPMSGGKVGQWLALVGSKPPSFQPCMTRDSHHFHSCNFPTMWWLCPFFMTISLLATLASGDHWSRFKNKSHEFIISQKRELLNDIPKH